jgi:hypothetical protein
MDAAYYTEVNGKRHLIVPYSFTHNDAKYVLPQGFSDPSSYFDTCRRGFDYLWEEGATLDDREPVSRVPPGLLLRDRRHADPVLNVFEFTPLGRRLLFVGRGRGVSRLSGLRVTRIRWGSFIMCGFFAGLAGIMYAGRLDPMA